MSTEIVVNNDIIEINVTEETIIIEAPSGAYPLPSGVYSVFGRTGNVIAQDGDYNLTQLGDVTISTPSTGQVLRYNGTAWVNSTESYVGTVTSVAASVPTGLTISGSPITTLGTLDFGLDTGYVIPLESTLDAKALKVTTISTTAPLTGGGDLSANRTFAIAKSTTSVDGYLAATDFTTFNNKQAALNGTGFVKISGTTISYDNSSYYLASNPSFFIPLTALSSTATGLTYTNTTGVFSTTTGYGIPTTASQTTWDTAYSRSLTSAAVTGTTTKTLTLNEQGGGTITASWTDINTDAVTSVFGRTGAVVAQSGDYTTTLVTEGTNLYYTDARARGAVSFTAGSGAYNSTTGVFTIPTNNNQITNGAAYITLTGLSATAPLSYSNTTGVFTISQATLSVNGYLTSTDWNTFNNKEGAITDGTITQYWRGDKTWQTLNTTAVTEAINLYYTQARFDSAFGAKSTTNLAEGTNLYYTDARARAAITGTSPISVTIGVVSITQSNTTTNGYLSFADWNTFNGKQAALNGTGFVKASGTTISYDNSTYLTTISGITAGGELSGTYANPSLVNSAVIAKVLTGVNITGGTIAATDSILTAFGKVQNQINGLIGGSIYKGTWNASTNTPALASGVGTSGNYYIVSVAGSTNLDGIADWNVGDWAIFQGTTWQKVDNTDAVVSVNGFTGAVSLSTSNINEGSNLYYTNARTIASSLTGYTSGAGTITSSDTILTAIQKLNGNVGSLVTGVSSVFGRTGAVVSVTGDYTTSQVTEGSNLYYTDTRARASNSFTAGSGAYNSTTGVITIPTNNNQITNGAGYITTADLTGYIPYTGSTTAIDLNAKTVVNISNLGINTTTVPTILLRVVGDNNSNSRIAMRGYSSNANSSSIRVTKFRGSAGTPQAPLSGDSLGKFELAGYGTTSSEGYPQASFEGLATENWGATARGSKAVIKITPNTTTTQVIALTINQDKSAVFENSVTGTSLIKIGGTSSQFLKADGSVDSSSYITLTSLSSSATGLTYTNTTGAFSLTAGYVIPTTTSATNWDTAYTNRITSLTTTGSSGSATLVSNVLNVPTYTLTGLGGQPLATNLTSLSGLSYVSGSFVKMTAAGTFSLDTNTYYLASNPNGFTSNVGTVTSVAALTLGTTGTDVSSSVATGTTTPVITLNIPTASATNRGALSSADWTTFNSKQAALTNPVTGTGTTNYHTKFTGASTIGNSLIWDNGTNVGIGNTSPSAKLDVSGGITLSGNGTQANNSLFTLSNGYMYLDGNTNGLILENNNTSSTRIRLEAADNMQFQTASTERMRITSGGDVLIGDTTANANLFVKNSGAGNTFGARNTNATFGATLGFFGADRNTTNNSFFYIDCYNYGSNSYRFRVADSGAITSANLAGTGSRAVIADAGGLLSAPVSDITVKQNIKPIGYGLNEILKMNPVWFDFIDEYKNYGIGRQNGNIAQEMEAIIPEAVFVTPSTGKMGINYDQLHAVYIKAIQEQNQTIQELKERLDKAGL